MGSMPSSENLPTLSRLLADLEAGKVLSRRDVAQQFATGILETPTALQTAAAAAFRAQSLADTEKVRFDDASLQELWQRLSSNPTPNSKVNALLLLLLLNIACVGSREACLQFINTHVLVRDWDNAAIDFVAETVDNAGLFEFIGAINLAEIGGQLGQRLQALPFNRVMSIMRFLGLRPHASHQRRDTAFRHLLMPVYRAACEADSVNEALSLEHLAYDSHIKRTETAENHTSCWSQINPIAHALGERAKGSIGTRAFRPSTASLPRVVFLVPNAVILAHTGLLLAYLRGWQKLENKFIEPIVYTLAGADPSPLRTELEALGVKYVFGPSLNQQRDPLSTLVTARNFFFDNGISQVVFVSLPINLAFCHGLQMAPAVSWWGMKFPLPNFDFLEMRLQCFALYKKRASLFGQDWCFAPQPQEALPIAPRSEIDAAREPYAGKFILGTIAREEKINAPEYLEAVTRILTAHPTACFLWTGRHRLPAIDQAFADAGVADRCHFIGWVNPEIYCSVFDLFLDTFPLSGIMPNQAMHAGVPVVSGNTNGAFTYLTDAPDGEPPYTSEQKHLLDGIFATLPQRMGKICADTTDEYVDIAKRLIEDEQLRRDFALAGKNFVDTVRFDLTAAAQAMSSHFADTSDFAIKKLLAL